MSLEYSKATVDSLLYHRYPKLLDSIVERRTDRAYPRTGQNATYTANSTIEFDMTSDQFIDLPTAVLHFTLSVTGGQTIASGGGLPEVKSDEVNALCKVANATDVMNRFECYYNDSTVERQSSDASAWANVFLAYSANKSYLEHEGSVLLGLSNQVVNADRGAGTYSVPLALVSGFFRMKYYLPMLGNRMRINIGLADDHFVLSKRAQSSCVYNITNVSLSYDTVIVQPQYRSEVIKAMASGEGFRIPYTSYLLNVNNPSQAGTQNFKISNNLSNALSLHMIYDPPRLTSAPVGSQRDPEHLLNRECFPVAGFQTLRVRSGTRQFTPSDDVRGYNELYISAEKTINNLNDIGGSGFIDYKTLTGGYTVDVDSKAGTYGLAVMSVNLEKSVEVDDAVINQGLSSMEAGATNEFDVRIEQSGAGTADAGIARGGVFSPLGRILSNIVHKSALVFSNGSVSVEY